MNPLPLAKELEVLADTGNRENILIDHNSCFSDLSHSIEFYRMDLHMEKLECFYCFT